MYDSIHGFCDRNCDKLFLEKLQTTDNTPIFRVKGEKWHFRSPRKTVAKR